MEHRRRLQAQFDDLTMGHMEKESKHGQEVSRLSSREQDLARSVGVQSSEAVSKVCVHCAGSKVQVMAGKSPGFQGRGSHLSRASRERIKKHPPKSPCFQRFAREL